MWGESNQLHPPTTFITYWAAYWNMGLPFNLDLGPLVLKDLIEPLNHSLPKLRKALIKIIQQTIWSLEHCGAFNSICSVLCHNIPAIMQQATRLFEDSFNVECELVLGGPLASRTETEKGPNEVEKIQWTFICTSLFFQRAAPTCLKRIAAKNTISRRTRITLGTQPHSGTAWPSANSHPLQGWHVNLQFHLSSLHLGCYFLFQFCDFFLPTTLEER